MIAIWEFYFFANILEFITWTVQHSFTSTSRIFELSMPPLALRGVLALPRGKYFWTIKVPQDCTWGQRAVLKLRSEVTRFIKFDVGDGRRFSYDMIIGILLGSFSLSIALGLSLVQQLNLRQRCILF